MSVAVVMGSISDSEVMQKAVAILEESKDFHSLNVVSAHREPEKVREFALNAKKNGIKVIIAGAGLAAALPGVLAAYTDLPIIGVPIASGALNGQDSLYSIAQMPSGVPVACMAINGSKNAALFAQRILKLLGKKENEK